MTSGEQSSQGVHRDFFKMWAQILAFFIGGTLLLAVGVGLFVGSAVAVSTAASAALEYYETLSKTGKAAAVVLFIVAVSGVLAAYEVFAADD